MNFQIVNHEYCEECGSIEWHGYPDVKVVIPQNTTREIRCNSADLLQAVKSARVFARDGSNVSRFHITENSFLVQGISEENGESVNTVPAQWLTVGPYSVLIGFNCEFLIDYLKNCTPGTVKIEFNGPTQPALFTEVNGFKAVIMPRNIEGLRHVITPAQVKTEDQYNTADAYVWTDELNNYTNRHPLTQTIRPSAPVEPHELSNQFPAPDDLTTTPAEGAVECEFQTWYQRVSFSGKYDKKGTPEIILQLAKVSIPVTIPQTVNA